jgi:hypothetical protein
MHNLLLFSNVIFNHHVSRYTSSRPTQTWSEECAALVVDNQGGPEMRILNIILDSKAST